MKESAGVAEHKFSSAFSEMSSAQCLILFRFEKQHVLDLVHILSWPENKTRTTRDGYSVPPILATCVILWRMSNTSPWRAGKALFGKHRSQLSEIFWEALSFFYEDRSSLIESPISKSYILDRAHMWADSVSRVSSTLVDCIGFVDGTVIQIARPTDNCMQKSCLQRAQKSPCVKVPSHNYT